MLQNCVFRYLYHGFPDSRLGSIPFPIKPLQSPYVYWVCPKCSSSSKGSVTFSTFFVTSDIHPFGPLLGSKHNKWQTVFVTKVFSYYLRVLLQVPIKADACRLAPWSDALITGRALCEPFDKTQGRLRELVRPPMACVRPIQ